MIITRVFRFDTYKIYLLKAADISLKNIIKKRTFFQDKLKENSNNSKELWKTLKSLGMNSKNVNQWKNFLKENSVTQFEPKKKMQIFLKFSTLSW